MKVTQYFSYLKKLFIKKTETIKYSIKHFNRYGKVFLSISLSTIIIGSVSGILAGVFVGLDKVEDKRDLVQYITSPQPDSYNWEIDFSTSSGTPASRLMSGLLRPRSKELDNINQIKQWIDSPNRENIRFKVGGRSFDLSNEDDLNYLKVIINKQVNQIPSDVPSDYGLLGFPSLDAKDKDGNSYDISPEIKNTFTLDGARNLKIYNKNEWTNLNGSTNAKGKAYEFELWNEFYWSNGDKVLASDYVYQIETLLQGPDVTLDVMDQKKDENDQTINHVITYIDTLLTQYNSLADVLKPQTLNSDSEILIDRFLKVKSDYDSAYARYTSSPTEENESLLIESYTLLRKSIDEYRTKIGTINQYDNFLSFLKRAFSYSTLEERQTYSSLITSLDNAITQLESYNFLPVIKLLLNDSFQESEMNLTNLYTWSDRTDSINLFASYVTNIENLSIPLSDIEDVSNSIQAFKGDNSKFYTINLEKGNKIQAMHDALLKVYTEIDFKSEILRVFLGFPPALFPVLVDNNVNVENVELDKNAILISWEMLSPSELMKSCSSTNLNRQETKWKGYDLKFYNGSEVIFFDTMGDLCDQYSIISSNENDNKVTIKIAKAFDTYWLFELVASSVIFLPIQKNYLEQLYIKNGDQDEVVQNAKYRDSIYHLLGGEFYARDVDSYLSNGPFRPVELGKTFKMVKNNRWPNKDFILPNSYTLYYVSESALNAVTLNFIRGTTGTTSISDKWYAKFQETQGLSKFANLVKSGTVYTTSWQLNVFDPVLTNNFFRTPIGEPISWSVEDDAKYPDKTIVHEYKLIDGERCEIQNTDEYYPSLTIDNFTCGLPPNFKGFSNAFRRFLGQSFDNGRARAIRGNSGNPSPYSFGMETLTPAGLSYDSTGEEYTKTVAIAMKQQNDNRIDLSDSSYDKSFTKSDGTIVSNEERPTLSFYGGGFDKNPWQWESTRKVGFSEETQNYETPSDDLIVIDPVTGEEKQYGYTPSFDFAKGKEMWKALEAAYPQYINGKNLQMYVPVMRVTDWRRLAVLDYWAKNVAGMTNNKVIMNVQAEENYFRTSLFFGRSSGLSCGQSDTKTSYSLYDENGDPILNCLRNPLLIYGGWVYDYSDPKNYLSTYAGSSYFTTSFLAQETPRHIIQYWLNNIRELLDKDEQDGKITSSDKSRYLGEIEEHLNALIYPGTKYTFQNSLNSSPVKDENDNVVIPLDEMTSYSRNKIIAQYEAWRIREGLTAPFNAAGRSPQASRLVNDFVFKAIAYRDSAYNCDASVKERTFTRVYYTSSGVYKKYEIVAPECLDAQILKYLSKSDYIKKV